MRWMYVQLYTCKMRLETKFDSERELDISEFFH